MPDAQPDEKALGHQQPELVEGLYNLTNKETRRLIDLDNGNATEGTNCHGCILFDNRNFANALWSVRRDGEEETYTLRNMRSNTFLDLNGGNKADGSFVAGHARTSDKETRANAEWTLKADDTGYYTLCNRRTGTYLQPENGNNDKPLIVCSSFVEGKSRQLWDLARASRSGEEIISIIGDWKESLLGQLCQTYRSDAQYVVIPYQVRKEIWEKTGLRDTLIRQYTFDYDDFVVKMKDAVSTWARQEYRMDGVALLFGIIYGQTKRGPCAFDWYLSPDLHALIFFDAQNGTEYSCAALDARGFQPSFATF